MADAIPGRAPTGAAPSPIAARAEAAAAEAKQRQVALLTPDQRRRIDIEDFIFFITSELIQLAHNRGIQAFSEIIGDGEAATAAENDAKKNAATMDVALDRFLAIQRAPTLVSPDLKAQINAMLEVAYSTAEGLGESLGGTQSIFPSDDKILMATIESINQLLRQTAKFFEQVNANISDPTKGIEPFEAPVIPVFPIPITPFPPDGKKATGVEEQLERINASLNDQLEKIRKFDKAILEEEAARIRRDIASAQSDLKKVKEEINQNKEGFNNILPSLTNCLVLNTRLLEEKVRETIVALARALGDEIPVIPNVEQLFRDIITPILVDFEFTLGSTETNGTFIMRVSFTPDAEDSVDFIDDTLGTAATAIEEQTGVTVKIERDFTLIPVVEEANVDPGPPPDEELANTLRALAADEFVIDAEGETLTVEDVDAGIADRTIDADEAFKLVADAQFAQSQKIFKETGLQVPVIGDLPSGTDTAAFDKAVAAADAAIAVAQQEPAGPLPKPFAPGVVPSKSLIPPRQR